MRRPILVSVLLVAVALLGLAAASLAFSDRPSEPIPPAAAAPEPSEETPDPAPSPTEGEPTVEPEPEPEPLHPIVDRRTVGQPWGTTPGLLTFRGNPTRTFYGLGPVPRDPEVHWRYPDTPMCITETLSSGETKRWCGTGWTAQPLVWERPDGVTEVIVGAYDGAVHFVDAETGSATRPKFQTGHMVKGTESLDPDGFPLLYTGSRDSKLRIVALDRDVPTELWALSAHPRRVWNNDWDGSPAIVNDIMYVGGEDSWFYAVKLNRGYDANGRVTVDPEVIFEMPGWTDELFSKIGDRNVSIENSVALYEGRVYFANSGGRIVGLDVARLEETGDAPIVFDFWTGDDTDATITIDEDGMLYVAVELQRFLPRALQLGQLLKLDPYTDGDPVVWGVHVPPRTDIPNDDGGIWSTPALHDGVLYVTTHPGDLLAVDAVTGEVLHRERIGYHEWGSPVVVDSTLVVPRCSPGGLLAYDVSDPRTPVAIWTHDLATGACIESTPAIWKGRIYVGARDGFLYSFAAR